MEVGLFFKFAHIGAMFMAVGVAVGTQIMAHRVATSGNVAAIRTYFCAAAHA